MTIIQTFILGIVEGITEFLPVSSTFHLIWTTKLLNIVQTDFVKLFLVFIQGGAILSVVSLYFKEIITNKKLFINLIFSFIPTAIAGLILYPIIKSVLFESLLFSTFVFIVIGIVILVTEKLVSNNWLKIELPISKLTLKTSILIGLFQSLALVPGVSRSGAVILWMMFLGFRREEAAKYSFMLSVPTILAASFFDLYKMSGVLAGQTDEIMVLAIGSLIAFITALFVVRFLISYLKNHSLNIFGWYRILIGIIMLLALVA